MAQLARPSADVTTTGWLTQGGASTSLFASIDEVDHDEADFITQQNGSNNNTCEIRLSSVTAALIDRAHVVSYRYRKHQALGNVRNLQVHLVQNTTIIASGTLHTDITVAWTPGAFILTPAQGATITDYTNLRLRFVPSGATNGTTARRQVQVAWAQLRVPDWQPTWDNDWGAAEETGAGFVRLTLDGETVEGVDSEQARLFLAERKRDKIAVAWGIQATSVYDEPSYRVWGFLRQPLARARWKIKAYTGIVGAESKLATFEARANTLAPQEYL